MHKFLLTMLATVGISALLSATCIAQTTGAQLAGTAEVTDPAENSVWTATTVVRMGNHNGRVYRGMKYSSKHSATITGCTANQYIAVNLSFILEDVDYSDASPVAPRTVAGKYMPNPGSSGTYGSDWQLVQADATGQWTYSDTLDGTCPDLHPSSATYIGNNHKAKATTILAMQGQAQNKVATDTNPFQVKDQY